MKSQQRDEFQKRTMLSAAKTQNEARLQGTEVNKISTQLIQVTYKMCSWDGKEQGIRGANMGSKEEGVCIFNGKILNIAHTMVAMNILKLTQKRD